MTIFTILSDQKQSYNVLVYFLHLASWFQCYQLNVTVTSQFWQTFFKIIISKGVEIGHFLLFFLAQKDSEFEKVDT